jgi:hypothetical protein
MTLPFHPVQPMLLLWETVVQVVIVCLEQTLLLTIQRLLLEEVHILTGIMAAAAALL